MPFNTIAITILAVLIQIAIIPLLLKKPLFLLLNIAIIYVLFRITFRKEIYQSKAAWPYYQKKILSQPEQILFNRLIKALPNYIIFSQVQLSRAIGVKKGFNFQQWNNKINQMSLDFVVCRKDSSIVTVIELDDNSHNKENQKIRDNKKTKALASANINLIRWNVRDIPDEVKITAAITERISDVSKTGIQQEETTRSGEMVD